MSHRARIRWLHLSDFHTGKDNYGQCRLFEELIAHVRSRVGREPCPDFVAITGDIANNGHIDQYREFNDAFLQPLTQLLQTGGGAHIFLVPGNHDVDRTEVPTTVSYDHADNHPHYFDPTEEGKLLRAPSFPRFQAYHEFLDQAESSGQRIDGIKPYWAQKAEINGLAVGLVGLSSVWLSQDPTNVGARSRTREWEERECLAVGVDAVSQSLADVSDSVMTFVLAHHPLSWLRPQDQEVLRAVMGSHGVLYLHGHLHKTRATVDEGGGHQFRTLQAGAAFQAREDDRWRNRFVWAEADLDNGVIVVEPRMWSHTQQDWVLDSDAYPEPYRQADRWYLKIPWLETNVAGRGWNLPVGWALIDADFLTANAPILAQAEVIAYFNGATPTWRHVASPSIPQREVVSRLVEDLKSAPEREARPVVRLLTGAGGEGKSTALMQAVVALANGADGWTVLWAERQGAALTKEQVLSLPRGRHNWLVASDDAESIAETCAAAAEALWQAGRTDVHFLLAARDTDWGALQADQYGWHQFSNFERIALRGISDADAVAIVEAWGSAGQEGLGRLSSVSAEERAMRLVTTAAQEAGREEGSFFGAMLRLRVGDGLEDHVRLLLSRLADRPGVRAQSLLDGFLLIAAPHAVNVRSLTLNILSEVLGQNEYVLRQRLLLPLGEEAAVTRDGCFILVRHRAIAEAAMRLAAEERGLDDAQYYEDLVRAVHRLRPTQRIPGFRDFNYPVVSRTF